MAITKLYITLPVVKVVKVEFDDSSIRTLSCNMHYHAWTSRVV